MSGKLRVLSELAALPTRQPFGVPIQRVPSRAASRPRMSLDGKMLIRRRLPGDVPDAIEAKQAEFRAQPEITVGRLGDVWIVPLEKPSRIFHAVCAYWLTSSAGFNANAHGHNASSSPA